ncbi:MAG: DUF3624 domain-containing protein [Psychromonas sp.]|nr:DUF3624 domain-containing protein [Alteromonadales bacterium]MCP5080048.1 DUF3624 domain-containing protein [Psychromonas sp.]
MACSGCDDNIWKQKLGRCKRCMWINFIILVIAALGSYFMIQESSKSVETIALLFTLFVTALLMLLHISAFIYYHFFKADKQSPK